MFIELAPNAGIQARYANRHGLVTGPTGTGKTVTIQTLIEGFSAAGVPVFAADVKGDLSALANSCPHEFLDVEGLTGEQVRVPMLALGADLLARALELTDAQGGCLEVAFSYARAYGIRVATIADLRRLLAEMSDNKAEISREFGAITPASIGVVQRAILRLESQGCGAFFGAPGFDIARLMGQPGLVSMLDAAKLIRSPRLYSVFMLWLLRELSDRLPEQGDASAPRLVMVFDEAHTIFDDCPPPLLRSIEQTARLIRSKGVGLYFASQSPDDLPEIVRAQLATRVEHGRAYGVGKAMFTTLDASGNATPPRLIAPKLPACPLGVYQGARLVGVPRFPGVGAAANENQNTPANSAAIGWQAWGLIALFIVFAGGVVWGFIQLTTTGQLVPALVALAAVLFFCRPKQKI